MQSDTPKQFLLVGGLPIIFHTFEAFINYDPSIEIVIALPEHLFEGWKELGEKLNFHHEHILSKGGETRFQTVKNALSYIDDDRIVAIHDAVRPFVSRQTIDQGFRDALTFGNAIPVITVNESVRWVDGKKNQPIDRDRLRIVQTPQIFEASMIKRAYQRVNREIFTDDASVVEAMGETIHLFEGNRENIKITYPYELQLAEVLIKTRQGKP
jgi:2-C-methyl-D-erythritol 4-phosphate cytidylyltransferase